MLVQGFEKQKTWGLVAQQHLSKVTVFKLRVFKRLRITLF